MQNACQPLYLEGRNITGRASAAVTGKRFVKISGNGTEGLPSVAHAAAGQLVFGVSGYDAASGTSLPVIRKGVVPVTAGAALAAGQRVQSDANGQAVVYVPPTTDPTATVAQTVDTIPHAGTVLFDAAAGADAFIALTE